MATAVKVLKVEKLDKQDYYFPVRGIGLPPNVYVTILDPFSNGVPPEATVIRVDFLLTPDLGPSDQGVRRRRLPSFRMWLGSS